MQRVAIIGVGLIGGSLGLVWKKQAPDVRIVGFDEPATLDKALALGALDEAASSVEDAVSGAQVVVLATPVASVLQLLEQIAPHVPPAAVVTDTGSVKGLVAARAAQVLPPHVLFVGGHPMAGSERRGIDQADALLFENAAWALCPPDPMDVRALKREQGAFLDLIEATGARALMLSPARHDRIAALVSHLPQLLAVALMNHVAEENGCDEAFLQLAAGGFRDMTRIASSPFDVWSDILATNDARILEALDSFAARMDLVRAEIAGGDMNTLQDRFRDARSARETIPRNTKGFLQPLADVYVYAKDDPGELFSITKILYEASLNIKDIELLKIREGTGGAFRMGFAEDDTATAAAQTLNRAGYTAWRL